MKSSTFKLLVPMFAVTIQANSASTVIPPYLESMRIPVALLGTLISLGPVLALASRLPVGLAYHQTRARVLLSLAMRAGFWGLGLMLFLRRRRLGTTL